MEINEIFGRIVWGLYPVSLALTIVIGGLVLIFRRDAMARRLILMAVIFHIVVYLGSLILEFVHPYWIDNGVEEFIPIGDRWQTALGPGAGLLELLLLPFFVVAIALWVRRSRIKNVS